MTLCAKILGCLVGAILVATGEGYAGTRAPAAVASIPPDQHWSASKALAKSRSETGEELALVFACTTSLLSGQYEAVDQLCGRAIVLRPSDPVPHKLYGISLLIQHRYERAANEFQEAVRLAPRDPGSEIGLGEALRGEDDYKGAIDAFTAALKLAPRDAGVWNARCWTRGLFAKDLEAGLGECNTALALTPGHPAYLDSRGLIYLRLGRPSEAIRDYNAAIAKNPILATARYGRGVAWLALGRIGNAAHDIRAARAADHAIDDTFYRAPLLPHACASVTVHALARCAKAGTHTHEPRLSGRSATNESDTQLPHRRRSLSLALKQPRE